MLEVFQFQQTSTDEGKQYQLTVVFRIRQMNIQWEEEVEEENKVGNFQLL